MGIRITGGGSPPQDAAGVPVDSSAFSGNLATTDDNVQKVANKVDGMSGGGGGGINAAAVRREIDARIPNARRVPSGGQLSTVLKRVRGTGGGEWAEQSAGDVTVDASAFDGNLGINDNTVQKVAQKFDDFSYSYELPDKLKLIQRNITTGGWRSDAALAVSAGSPGAAAYTLATARTAAFSSRYPPTANTDLGPATTRPIVVRVARSLYESVPIAAESSRIRVNFDEENLVSRTLAQGTHLGRSADNRYDYFSMGRIALPAEAVLTAQVDAPTELENVAIPSESITGLTATLSFPDILMLSLEATFKTITTVNGRVVKSDWSTVNVLRKDAATEGVTVAGNRITFAQAKKVTVHGVFRTSGNNAPGATGGSRIYNFFRFVKTSATPDETIKQSVDGSYQKATASETQTGQGPPFQITTFNFNLDAEANDVYEVQWLCFSQENGTVTLDHANSEIDITFREPRITLS